MQYFFFPITLYYKDIIFKMHIGIERNETDDINFHTYALPSSMALLAKHGIWFFIIFKKIFLHF